MASAHMATSARGFRTVLWQPRVSDVTGLAAGGAVAGARADSLMRSEAMSATMRCASHPQLHAVAGARAARSTATGTLLTEAEGTRPGACCAPPRTGPGGRTVRS